MKPIYQIIIAAGVGLLCFSASADILDRTIKWTDFGYGYGNSSWSQMSSMLDAASGNGMTPLVDLSNASEVSAADALWIDLGPLDPAGSGLLSVTEVVNIQNFVASGKRVVIIGENDSWTSWNSQITELLGGSYSGGISDGLVTSIVSHELTDGVSAIYIPLGGAANGGTTLFSQAVASLYGPFNNALVIMDVNVFDDNYISNVDNGVFAQNVANWIAIPEPASVGLIAMVGMGGCFARRRFLR